MLTEPKKMVKRIATTEEVRLLWDFLNQHFQGVPPLEKFDEESMIAIWADETVNARIAIITAVNTCGSPKCDCRIIQIPSVLTIRGDVVAFPFETPTRDAYYLPSPDKDKVFNVNPQLN